MTIHWDPSHHTPYDDEPEPDPRVSRIEEILDEACCDCTASDTKIWPYSSEQVLYLLTEEKVEEIRKLATALSDDLMLETNRECSACMSRMAEEYRQENERN